MKTKKTRSPHRLLSIACRQLANNAETNHRYHEASHLRYSSFDARRLVRFYSLSFWRLDCVQRQNAVTLKHQQPIYTENLRPSIFPVFAEGSSAHVNLLSYAKGRIYFKKYIRATKPSEVGRSFSPFLALYIQSFRGKRITSNLLAALSLVVSVFWEVAYDFSSVLSRLK